MGKISARNFYLYVTSDSFDYDVIEACIFRHTLVSSAAGRYFSAKTFAQFVRRAKMHGCSANRHMPFIGIRCGRTTTVDLNHTGGFRQSAEY